MKHSIVLFILFHSFFNSLGQILADSTDNCCPTAPASTNLLYNEHSSKGQYNIKFYGSLYTHELDGNGYQTFSFPQAGTNEFLKTPISKGIRFNIEYEKDRAGSASGKTIKVYEPDGTVRDVTNLFYEMYCTNDWTNCYQQLSSGNFVTFDKIGTHKIEASATFDPLIGSTETVTIHFWVCIYPDASYGFPNITATAYNVDPVCNGTIIDVNGPEMEKPFEYYYRTNINSTNKRLNEIVCRGYQQNPVDNITIFLKNHCTGANSSDLHTLTTLEYKESPFASIQANSGFIENNTVKICQDESMTFTSNILSGEVTSYQWQYGVDNGDNTNFYDMSGKTGTSLQVGPGLSPSTINSSLLKEDSPLRLYVGSPNGCTNNPDLHSCVIPSNNWFLTVVSAPVDPDFSLDYTRLRAGELVSVQMVNANDENGTSKIFDWGDGFQTDMSVADHIGSHKYISAGNYQLTYTKDNGICSKDTTKVISVYQPLCTIISPVQQQMGMQFREDAVTGAVFLDMGDECKEDVIFPCFSGQAQNREVVATNATRYADQWGEEYILTENGEELNVFEAGNRGMFRPQSSYAYNTSVKYYENDNLSTPKSSSVAGTFPYSFFNYASEISSSAGWLKATTITRYSKNGEPIEEFNALGIPSTAHFGYNDAVPILTAQNARYDEVFVEDFEFNSDANQQELYVHSGKVGLSLSQYGYQLPVKKVTEHIKDVGLIMQFWLYAADLGEEEIVQSFQGLLTFNDQPLTLNNKSIVAQSSGWFLIEILVENSLFANVGIGEEYMLEIKNTANADMFIDDLRMQPFDSQMTAYVYDGSNLRLLAVLDDRNFAMFYQYDAEGRLIRKKIETVEGAKTIQETFYNVPGNQYTNE